MLDWCKIHSSTLFFSILFLVVILFCILLICESINWIILIISIILFCLFICKEVYPNEIKKHKEDLVQEKYITDIMYKIDNNYGLEVEKQEIFSKNTKQEMIEKYKDNSQYFIDYDDKKKVIYIKKQPYE